MESLAEGGSAIDSADPPGSRLSVRLRELGQTLSKFSPDVAEIYRLAWPQLQTDRPDRGRKSLDLTLQMFEEVVGRLAPDQDVFDRSGFIGNVDSAWSARLQLLLEPLGKHGPRLAETVHTQTVAIAELMQATQSEIHHVRGPADEAALLAIHALETLLKLVFACERARYR